MSNNDDEARRTFPEIDESFSRKNVHFLINFLKANLRSAGRLMKVQLKKKMDNN